MSSADKWYNRLPWSYGISLLINIGYLFICYKYFISETLSVENFKLAAVFKAAPFFSIFSGTLYCMKSSIKHLTNNSWSWKWLPWYVVYPLFCGVIGVGICGFLLIFIFDYDAAKYEPGTIITDIVVDPYDSITIFISCLMAGFYTVSSKHFDDWTRNSNKEGTQKGNTETVQNPDGSTTYKAELDAASMIRGFFPSPILSFTIHIPAAQENIVDHQHQEQQNHTTTQKAS